LKHPSLARRSHSACVNGGQTSTPEGVPVHKLSAKLWQAVSQRVAGQAPITGLGAMGSRTSRMQAVTVAILSVAAAPEAMDVAG